MASNQNQINKHGLKRAIPAHIKRQIRKQSGFGCVVCGLGIYEYEHVDPPFSEATKHDPMAMTLLCGSCHSQVTHGFWSKSKIKDDMKRPYCVTNGPRSAKLDIGQNHPTIVIGPAVFSKTTVVLEILGTPLLSIDPPESIGEPFRLSGTFYNDLEEEIFRIDQNEWSGNLNNWDIEIKGSSITIRRERRIIALRLRLDPPNQIVIERLNMQYKGYRVQLESNQSLEITTPSGVQRIILPASAKKAIITSLDFIPQEDKDKVLAQPDEGIHFTDCTVAIQLGIDGKTHFGVGGSMDLSRGGSIINTF